MVERLGFELGFLVYEVAGISAGVYALMMCGKAALVVMLLLSV
jgi:hypothetical protein